MSSEFKEEEEEFVDAEGELDEDGDASSEKQPTPVDVNEEETQAASAEIEGIVVVIDTDVKVVDITVRGLDTTNEITAATNEITPVFTIAETVGTSEALIPTIDCTNTHQINNVSIPDKEDVTSETTSVISTPSTTFMVTGQGEEDDADDHDGFQVVSYKKRIRRTVLPTPRPVVSPIPATHKVSISIPADTTSTPANIISNPAKTTLTNPTKTGPARKHSAPAAKSTMTSSSPISWASMASKAASTTRMEECRREVELSEERSSSLSSTPSSAHGSQRSSRSSCSTSLSSNTSSTTSKRTSAFSWADDDLDMNDFDLGDWEEGISSSGSESVLFTGSEGDVTLVEDSGLTLPEVCYLHDLVCICFLFFLMAAC
ncbi:hypothetical protein BDQ12DRAFT_525014 [Crucibulum laeve]|uniref:Uncharacterized protein n=1 Tax=Crucibulum laeve TaxID=68775 RepID=A0A5C3LHG7_9AGAR|nr:hypothetical protein BDQ12DRAFT_525014 [Crucibulum laeve]